MNPSMRDARNQATRVSTPGSPLSWAGLRNRWQHLYKVGHGNIYYPDLLARATDHCLFVRSSHNWRSWRQQSDHSWSVQSQIKWKLFLSSSYTGKILAHKLPKPHLWRLWLRYNQEILPSYNWQLRHHHSATAKIWPHVLEFTRRPAWCPAPRWLELSYNYWEDQWLLQLY